MVKDEKEKPVVRKKTTKGNQVDSSDRVVAKVRKTKKDKLTQGLSDLSSVERLIDEKVLGAASDVGAAVKVYVPGSCRVKKGVRARLAKEARMDLSKFVVRALAKYVRISPKRSMFVADVVRGKKVYEACDQLSARSCKASRCILKVLRSAMGNARDRFKVGLDGFVVSYLTINKGPVLRRAKARNKGGRSPIRRPMSHIEVKISCDCNVNAPSEQTV